MWGRKVKRVGLAYRYAALSSMADREKLGPYALLACNSHCGRPCGGG